MSKLAMYLRLSKEDYQKKGESVSISNQRELLSRFVNEDKILKEYQVIEYRDDGFSGTNQNRPAFQRLIDDIKNNQVNVIVVKDMSRFSRDYVEMGNYLENIFPFMGIRFISVNDNYDSEKDQKNGLELDTQFKTLLYDFYSKELSQKNRSIALELKSQGKYLSGDPVFGYLRDPHDKYKVIVDEKVAPIVREIFELILEGYSCREIANRFNEKGYITCSARKKEIKPSYSVKSSVWTRQVIAKLSRNEFYTGDFVYNRFKETKIGGRKVEKLPEDEWRWIYNNHEAIVSKETFLKAQEMKRKKECRHLNQYKVDKKELASVFSKKVYCQECGKRMYYRSEYRISSKNDKYTYKGYFCESCYDNTATNYTKEEFIKKAVLEKRDSIPALAYEDKNIENRKLKKDYSKELAAIDHELQKEYECYKNNKIDKKKYLQNKQDILIRKQKLQQIMEKENILKVKQEILNPLVDEEVTKEFVDTFIEKIVVSRYGAIEVVFKNKYCLD